MRSPVKAAGFTPRFAQLDKKVLRYFGVFEDLLDPAIVGNAPAGKFEYAVLVQRLTQVCSLRLVHGIFFLVLLHLCPFQWFLTS